MESGISWLLWGPCWTMTWSKSKVDWMTAGTFHANNRPDDFYRWSLDSRKKSTHNRARDPTQTLSTRLSRRALRSHRPGFSSRSFCSRISLQTEPEYTVVTHSLQLVEELKGTNVKGGSRRFGFSRSESDYKSQASMFVSLIFLAAVYRHFR